MLIDCTKDLFAFQAKSQYLGRKMRGTEVNAGRVNVERVTERCGWGV